MRLEGIWSNSGTGLLGGLGQAKTEEKNLSSLPKSWGSDSVSFSPEALAALQASRANSAGSAETSLDAPSGFEENSSAGDAFKTYMEKKRSRAQGGEDFEEMIKRLKEKAAEVSKEIEQVARDSTISEAERDAKLQSLNNQLQQIQIQIGELERDKLKEQVEGQEDFSGEKQAETGGVLGVGGTQKSKGLFGNLRPAGSGRYADPALFEREEKQEV